MVAELKPEQHNTNINVMLKKLDDMYKEEERLIKQLQQMQMDKELLQTMIMYYYAKNF